MSKLQVSDHTSIAIRAHAGVVPVYCAHDALEPIGSLVPHPRNPNTHPERQIAVLASIITGQGWRAPITVSRRSGFVIKGHGRLQAAQMMGAEVVPVEYQSYADEASEWADMIADNRIAELSQFDFDMLAGLIKEFDQEALAFTGYSDLELASFLDAEWRPPHAPPLPEDGATSEESPAAMVISLDSDEAALFERAREALVKARVVPAKPHNGGVVAAMCRRVLGDQ